MQLRAEKSIYIPLCFYLYFYWSKDAIEYELFTFHYVSTYTVLRQRKAINDRIYIPLCFYLYSRENSGERLQWLIYIPLCFYLYYSA